MGTSRKAIILRAEGTKPSRVAWSPFTAAGNLPRESPGRPAQSSQRSLLGEVTSSDSWRCALANSCVRGSRRACCCRLTVSCPTGVGMLVPSGRCCLSPRSSLKEPDAVPPSGVRDPAARPASCRPRPFSSAVPTSVPRSWLFPPARWLRPCRTRHFSASCTLRLKVPYFRFVFKVLLVWKVL